MLASKPEKLLKQSGMHMVIFPPTRGKRAMSTNQLGMQMRFFPPTRGERAMSKTRELICAATLNKTQTKIRIGGYIQEEKQSCSVFSAFSQCTASLHVLGSSRCEIYNTPFATFCSAIISESESNLRDTRMMALCIMERNTMEHKRHHKDRPCLL